MAEPWMPLLHVTEAGERCRLWLSGCTYGDGTTLQEAADDLVSRVLGMAAHLREGAPARGCTDLPGLDPRLVSLMFEVGQIAADGGDIRARLFGVASV